MAKLHLLGTGSGLLNPARYPSAYLLETDTGDILFDSGEPVSSTLVRKKYDWRNLKGIFISHTHADHLGGFPMVLQQIHLSRRPDKLTIYSPLEYTENLLSHIKIYHLFPEKFSFDLEIFPLEDKKTFKICGLEVTSFVTKHIEKIGIEQSFSFKINFGEKSFFYSGDISSFKEIKKHLTGCTIALIETTHIEIKDIFKWAEKSTKTSIILTHIADDFDINHFKALMDKEKVDNITLAQEGGALII